MPRIVVFGATGYTGRLVAEALVHRGQRPLLAGRDVSRLDRVAAELGGGVEVAVADASRPGSVAALVDRGDVLLSTAGPFARWGDAVVEAAIARGAHYLDSNGEPWFTRRVFDLHGPASAAAGTILLTAFGWESVLGNVAGALALREAGDRAVRIDTGYFYTLPSRFSGGTRASFAEAMIRPSFAYREGAVRAVRGAERYRTMPVAGRLRPGVSLGASEHIALPRSFPQLREVNAYQGWFGRLSPRLARPLHRMSGAGFALLAVPGVRAFSEAASHRLLKGSTGGPGAAERARGAVHVAGMVYDPQGNLLAQAHLTGPDGYEVTAALLAWGSEQIAAGAVHGAGALGPVEAFGIEQLRSGCREAGIEIATGPEGAARSG